MKLNELTLTNPYLTLPAKCYDRVSPTPLDAPYLIHANKDVAKVLEIDEDELQTDTFVKWLNAEYIHPHSEPFAMCYAGHQFGYFVPRLGDGRAVNIGTIGKYHLQLKGAGKTKYSRGGDDHHFIKQQGVTLFFVFDMRKTLIDDIICQSLKLLKHPFVGIVLKGAKTNPRRADTTDHRPFFYLLTPHSML